MTAPSRACIAVLVLAAACGEPAAKRATPAASAPPVDKRAECAELERLLLQHREEKAKTAGEPDAVSTFDAKMVTLYDQHGEALKKLNVRDPEVKKLVDDYSAAIEKARGAARWSDEAPERKAKALADFLDAVIEAEEVLLRTGPEVCG